MYFQTDIRLYGLLLIKISMWIFEKVTAHNIVFCLCLRNGNEQFIMKKQLDYC